MALLSILTRITSIFAVVALALFLALVLVVFLMYRWLRWDRSELLVSKPQVFAFFHPYASGGGGGERVLWKIIENLQNRVVEGHESSNNNIHIVIYTLDPPDATTEYDLRQDVRRRFDIDVPKPVQLVSLSEHQNLLNPKPFLSLLWESFGTMRLAHRAIQSYPHFDVFVDTTGCAFTFLVVRFWSLMKYIDRQRETNKETNNNAKPALPWIVAYVHYPTISTDMMAFEWKKMTQNEQQQPFFFQRKIKTMIKLVYYRFFAILYGCVGNLADIVMVNSTWTYNHISSLWWKFSPSSSSSSSPATTSTTTKNAKANSKYERNLQIIYPPCRVPSSKSSAATKQNQTSRQPTIVSIGQFRPEKNHKLQIEALDLVLSEHPELRQKNDSSSPSSGTIQLKLIGSCRNDADRGRVDELRSIVNERGLEDSVEFCINPPYKELQESMFVSSIGIHTMREEHFGIGIVEMMAAGLLVAAHDSGGPQTDIVQTAADDDGAGNNATTTITSATGFRATTAREYADAIYMGLYGMSDTEKEEMRVRAQISATRFSDDAFDERLNQQIFPILFGKEYGR